MYFVLYNLVCIWLRCIYIYVSMHTYTLTNTHTLSHFLNVSSIRAKDLWIDLMFFCGTWHLSIFLFFHFFNLNPKTTTTTTTTKPPTHQIYSLMQVTRFLDSWAKRSPATCPRRWPMSSARDGLLHRSRCRRRVSVGCAPSPRYRSSSGECHLHLRQVPQIS